MPPVAAVSNLSSPNATVAAAPPGAVAGGDFRSAMTARPDTPPATPPVAATALARDTTLTIAATIATADAASTTPAAIASDPVAAPAEASGESSDPERAPDFAQAEQSAVTDPKPSAAQRTATATARIQNGSGQAPMVEAPALAHDTPPPPPVDAPSHDTGGATRGPSQRTAGLPENCGNEDTATVDGAAIQPTSGAVATAPPVPSPQPERHDQAVPDASAAADRGSGGLTASVGETSPGTLPTTPFAQPEAPTGDAAPIADPSSALHKPDDLAARSSHHPAPEVPSPSNATAAPPSQGPTAPPGASPLAPPPLRRTIDAGTARAGVAGRDIGLAIARHANRDGASTLTIRLDPVELGRVEVRMQIDSTGKLSATISAEHATALDLLRRDSALLAQTLSQAGMQADAGSFRFDTQPGPGNGGGNGANPGGGNADRGWAFAAATRRPGDDPEDPRATHAPSTNGIRASGRINLVA